MSKEILQKIWTERNPQHEVNADTGKDMFFDTVMMVIKDYNAVNKNFVLADVRGQLIAFLRQQTKLHYVSIYENDFEFADKILKAINLP